MITKKNPEVIDIVQDIVDGFYWVLGVKKEKEEENGKR